MSIGPSGVGDGTHFAWSPVGAHPAPGALEVPAAWQPPLPPTLEALQAAPAFQIARAFAQLQTEGTTAPLIFLREDVHGMLQLRGGELTAQSLQLQCQEHPSRAQVLSQKAQLGITSLSLARLNALLERIDFEIDHPGADESDHPAREASNRLLDFRLAQCELAELYAGYVAALNALAHARTENPADVDATSRIMDHATELLDARIVTIEQRALAAMRDAALQDFVDAVRQRTDAAHTSPHRPAALLEAGQQALCRLLVTERCLRCYAPSADAAASRAGGHDLLPCSSAFRSKPQELANRAYMGDRLLALQHTALVIERLAGHRRLTSEIIPLAPAEERALDAATQAVQALRRVFDDVDALQQRLLPLLTEERERREEAAGDETAPHALSVSAQDALAAADAWYENVEKTLAGLAPAVRAALSALNAPALLAAPASETADGLRRCLRTLNQAVGLSPRTLPVPLPADHPTVSLLDSVEHYSLFTQGDEERRHNAVRNILGTAAPERFLAPQPQLAGTS